MKKPLRPHLMLSAVMLAAMASCSDVPQQEEAVRQAAPAAPSSVVLRVSVADLTESRPPTGRPEVWLRGAGSWYPNMNFGSDFRDYEARRIGATDTLFVYPQGRDSPEIRVPARISSDLCPQGCPRDMVLVEIHDGYFLVSGMPLAEEIRVDR